jgi:hypothetical protein
MTGESSGASLGRCLVVWAAVSAAVAGLLTYLAADLGRVWSLLTAAGLGAIRFDTLLTLTAAVALAGCAVWFWLVSSVVVFEAASGSVPRLGQGVPCPAYLRRLLLGCCGAALVGGLSAPAMAVPVDIDSGRTVVSGLPLPDRATSDQVREPALAVPRHPHRPLPDDEPSTTVRVEPGDSLWRIAERHLPATVSDDAIDEQWQRLYAVNRDVIGANPDLIHPGLRLELPHDRKDF